MDWQNLLTALALMLVLEGIIPFLNPGGLRRAFDLMNQLSDSQLRSVGLVLMVGGGLLLYFIRGI